MASPFICSVDGCEKPRVTHGMCVFHWRRHQRGVDLHAPSAHANRGQPAAFMRMLLATTETDCVQWPFARNPDGRGVVKIGRRMRLVHRELCAVVHGPPPTERHEAAHLCGKGHEGCVNPNHVVWKTPLENKADMLRHGTRKRGEAVPTSKLTADEVRELRRLAATGAYTQRDLSEIFGLSQGSVCKIVNRKLWHHI